MTLDAYLASPGAKSLTALAGEAKVSKGRLSQLRHATDWPADLALEIEKATAGALNASDLSPVVAKARLPQGGPAICGACDLMAEDPAVRSCTAPDCPLAQREAA